MGIGEASAAGCELVYVRRVHASGTIAGEVTIATSSVMMTSTLGRAPDVGSVRTPSRAAIPAGSNARRKKRERRFCSWNELASNRKKERSGRRSAARLFGFAEGADALFVAHATDEQGVVFFDHDAVVEPSPPRGGRNRRAQCCRGYRRA